jgi:hypothetical protein
VDQPPHGLGRAGHVGTKQFAALPGSVNGYRQDGHVMGGTMSRSPPVRFEASSTPATNGITSPARRTSTVSPIWMPRPDIGHLGTQGLGRGRGQVDHDITIHPGLVAPLRVGKRS